MAEEIQTTSSSPLNTFVIIIIAIISLFFGLIFNFPFSQKLEAYFQKRVSQIPNCNIRYNDIKTSMFLPSIKLDSPVIDGMCIQQPGMVLKFKSLNASFGGLAISPFGLKFSVDGLLNNSQMSFQIVVGFSSMAIRISEMDLNLTDLKTLLPKLEPVNGIINIDGVFFIEKNKIESGNFIVISKNFTTNEINAGILKLPPLNINHLKLSASIPSPNIIEFRDFVIGEEGKSPIQAKLDGKLNLVQSNFLNSQLDLKGELRLDRSLATIDQALGFLNFQKNEAGNYIIKYKGTLNRPSF